MLNRAWLFASLVVLACGDKGPGTDGGTGGAGGGTAGVGGVAGGGGAGGGGGSGGTGGGGIVAGALSLSGRVALAPQGGGAASAESGVTVRATFDANANGTIEAGESATATTSTEGRYSLSLPLTGAARVVVSFSEGGAATLYRTVLGAPGGAAVLNVTLQATADISCTGDRCALANDSLSLRGLPEGTTGTARVFNPVSEGDAFPGDFADRDGNLLLSGVFAAVELKSRSGAAMHTLTSPATLRLRLPFDTWGIVTDITPGDAQISVPLYAFDEIAGTWVRDGSGTLQDGNGATIPATALASIRDGSFAGTVYVAGQVSHFSYWNVDWPVASHGCVRGQLLWPDGGAALGASVTGVGLTYTGVLPHTTIVADGTFCLTSMRAEAPTEDLDGDGVLGEQHAVSLSAHLGPDTYELGTKTLPVPPASCGGGCADLGTVLLTAERRQVPRLCTVSGQVRDRTGRPVRDATVILFDNDDQSESGFNQLCFDDAGTTFLCSLSATTNADGGFRVTNVIVAAPQLFLSKTVHESAQVTADYMDSVALRGCPAAPVNPSLTNGMRTVHATLSFDAGVIRWTPSGYGAAVVSVSTATGDLRWGWTAEPSVLPPITYGVLPSGAEQYFPSDGGVSALRSTDVVDVYLHGTSTDGLTYAGSAHGPVP